MNVLGIVAYVVAGFFLYALNLIVAFNDPSLKGDPRVVMVPIFLVPAIVAWLAGLGLRGRARWRRDGATLLLSVAAFDAMMGLMWVCLLATPEAREMMKPETFTAVGDYTSFLIVLSTYVLLGSLLLYSTVRRPAKVVAAV